MRLSLTRNFCILVVLCVVILWLYKAIIDNYVSGEMTQLAGVAYTGSRT